MIRVAQMMIAYSLTRHIKSRIGDNPKNQVTVDELMKIILPLFLDDYRKHEAPFGIHNIVEEGKKLIKKGAGDWYGAHSISQVIKEVNEKYNSQYNTFKLLTFNEGVIYKNEITSVFGEHKNNGCVVLVPLRLGLKKIDKSYHPHIKRALSNRLSVGILGGKNIYALYWVGYYNEKLITLDPHTEQDVETDINDDSYTTYVNRYPKVISLNDWDTTMAFWFYLKDQEDAQYFYDSVEQWKEESPEDYLICIQDQKKELHVEPEEAQFEDDFELI